jgi:hypothetical protein
MSNRLTRQEQLILPQHPLWHQLDRLQQQINSVPPPSERFQSHWQYLSRRDYSQKYHWFQHISSKYSDTYIKHLEDPWCTEYTTVSHCCGVSVTQIQQLFRWGEERGYRRHVLIDNATCTACNCGSGSRTEGKTIEITVDDGVAWSARSETWGNLWGICRGGELPGGFTCGERHDCENNTGLHIQIL